MKKQELKQRVVEILRGIDESEVETQDGWWETFSGADFGKQKLAEVLEAIEEYTP